MSTTLKHALTLLILVNYGCTTPSVRLDSATYINSPHQPTSNYEAYITIKAKYTPGNSQDLPGNLTPGTSLADMCESKLTFNDNSLESVVSIKIPTLTTESDHAIPVFAAKIKNGGTLCDITEEEITIPNIPLTQETLEIKYGLTTSSEGDIYVDEAIEVITTLAPAASPGTVIYRIATEKALKSISEKASSNAKSSFRSGFNHSRSIELKPLHGKSEAYIAVKVKNGENEHNAGYIKITATARPSLFTERSRNNIPDYSFLPQLPEIISSDNNTRLSDLRTQQITNIQSQTTPTGLEAVCKNIQDVLKRDFGLLTYDQAYYITSTLSANKNFNAEIPILNELPDKNITTVQNLKTNTNLSCLKGYQEQIAQSKIPFRIPEYDAQIEEQTKRVTYLDWSISAQLLANLSQSLSESTPVEDAIRLLKNSTFSGYTKVKLYNETGNIKLSKATPSGSQEIETDELARLLTETIRPGKIGCYHSLASPLSRAALSADEYHAYALIESSDKSFGKNGWARLLIARAPAAPGKKSSVYQLGITNLSSNENETITRIFGESSSKNCTPSNS
ncbi:hypothetical protein SAMN05878276_2231 [Aquipseudomonas alcaligenes]|uniref:hypothetical protein n=1 Tax=Aquipseudomonas alcaligenes TaxID=43263 RepID=UPI0009565FD5|nr:hypothetical protein [Pseudomonas alcaligenes]SIS11436.1 hypothetical protein SAMN05878276_2231 [Pseudomonas alcaligenes]